MQLLNTIPLFWHCPQQKSMYECRSSPFTFWWKGQWSVLFFILWSFLRAMSVKILPRPEDCYGPSYSMYVWTKGFDNAVPGSDSIFMDWDTGNETYFNHTWDTHEKRQWMWATCCRTGRRIGEVYLSGTHDILKTAYKLNNPAYAGMDIVRQTVREGHEQVPGLNIFALYAASDLPVTEQKQVRYVVWYNDVCAGICSIKHYTTYILVHKRVFILLKLW